MNTGKTCPHCHSEIIIRELRYQGLWKNYRVCPNCSGLFTPDTGTKYLQACCIAVALISLAVTLLLYFRGTEWLAPAIATYVLLGLIIYRGNKRLYFVPYKDNKHPINR